MQLLISNSDMPRHRDEPPAVRVYTVCDESRYLIVRNVPALGCGDELLQLFASYGDVEECKPMDAEECEQYTDVYWIKFHRVSNARFAKRKLDEFVFLGNRLQVSYAPQFESVSDTMEKLEGRGREVLARLNSGRKGSVLHEPVTEVEPLMDSVPFHSCTDSQQLISDKTWNPVESYNVSHIKEMPMTKVSSDQAYFPSQSMNQTVQLVREKLDKIQSTNKNIESGSASKKMRVDNRRRI